MATFIDRCTEYEITAPMKRVHTQYGEVAADVTGDIGQRARGDKDLFML